jgi:hypothetical protein
MTKISTALIAVAIAIVFLKKVIENKKDFTRYVKHFSIFALIALPIGLWFPIKNFVLYDIPFTYVQSVDDDNDANISKYSTLERFFKINDGQLESINIDMSKENAEYNLYTTTIKSYIVDEYIEDYKSTYGVDDNAFAEFVGQVTQTTYEVTPENIESIVTYIKDAISTQE